MRLPLDSFQFEISGKCNALCPYCITGQKNRRKEETGYFIDPTLFSNAIDHLLENGIIDHGSIVSLYNYGEPFLHPKFDEIIDILNNRKIKYEISTNASVIPDEKTIKKMFGLTKIQFSVCGSSQESYARIHGLSYTKTHNNIKRMVSLLHSYYPHIECILKLQMYRFNENEFNEALEFAISNSMNVIPLHAIYANLQQQLEFIEKFKRCGANTESSDHLWYYLPKLLDGPKHMKCPQWDSMVIDEEQNVALCCMVTKDMREYKISDVYTVDKSILESRRNNVFCEKCLSSGTARSICDTPSYRKGIYYNEIFDGLSADDIVVFGNSPLSSSFRNMYPNYRCSPSADKEELYAYVKKGKFIIVADRYWWTKRDVLEELDLVEKKDFIIYNTYLRGEV